MSQTVGLYIHIPFCRKKCDYCDFYSLPAQDSAVWDEYCKVLTKHIRETATSLAKHIVDTIYFGGGTPSLLGANRLRSLLDTIEKHCRISPGAEITLEGNPDSLDVKLLKKLRRAGFNRLSIGMQSFDNDTLSILGRAHDADGAVQAMQAARTAGFQNVSLDLLFGLPVQSQNDWVASLRAGIDLQPEHISCYGLTREKGTPLYTSELPFPDDDMQADMYLQTSEILQQAGYHHYEISNFCRPGYECRHNMKYWTLQPYVGLGPAAHSDFGGRRWSYERDLDRYVLGINESDALIDNMEDIPPLERAGEYLMLRLRTAQGISGNEYTRLFHHNFDSVERRLEMQLAHGLALREGDRWRLTEKGFLLSNRVIGEVLDATDSSFEPEVLF